MAGTETTSLRQLNWTEWKVGHETRWRLVTLGNAAGLGATFSIISKGITTPVLLGDYSMFVFWSFLSGLTLSILGRLIFQSVLMNIDVKLRGDPIPNNINSFPKIKETVMSWLVRLAFVCIMVGTVVGAFQLHHLVASLATNPPV